MPPAGHRYAPDAEQQAADHVARYHTYALLLARAVVYSMRAVVYPMRAAVYPMRADVYPMRTIVCPMRAVVDPHE